MCVNCGGTHVAGDKKYPVRERPVEIARAEQKVSYAEAVKRVEDYGSRVSSMPRPIQSNTSLCFSKVGFLAFIAMVINCTIRLVGGAILSFPASFLFLYQNVTWSTTHSRWQHAQTQTNAMIPNNNNKRSIGLRFLKLDPVQKFSICTETYFSQMFCKKCDYIPVSEHFTLAKTIHPLDRCGISRS